MVNPPFDPEPETSGTLRPPQTEQEKIDWIRLLRSPRIGPRSFLRLLRQYQSAKRAIAALPSVAKKRGLPGWQVCPMERAIKEWDEAKQAGHQFLALGQTTYPAALATLPDPPPFLWALGQISLLCRPKIAIVGARNASSLGQRLARRLSGELGAQGYVITSGLARCIDAAAHKTALGNGTIALLANGLCRTYPKENADLQQAIAKNGLLLSEHPPNQSPQSRHFPQRNRLISGLSAAIVVVEGAERSGSLITARFAAEQGREVMAVPGNPLDGRAAGCNRLIRDGAILVRTSRDILAALPTANTEPAQPQIPRSDRRNEKPRQPLPNAGTQQKLLSLTGPSQSDENDILRDCRRKPGAALAHVTRLELNGRLKRLAGGSLVRR